MNESSECQLKTAFGDRYAEFRALAAMFVARENFPECPSPTSLLHHAWLRVSGQSAGDSVRPRVDRKLLATMMERILIEKARVFRRRSELLREAVNNGDYSGPTVVSGDHSKSVPDLVDLERSLLRLQDLFPEKASLVRLRFFGGFSLAECAEMMGISDRTADRYWQFARAWLIRDMEEK